MPEGNAQAEKQMIKAAKAGDVEMVRSLLESDAGLIGARDSDGSTALHCAAWKGHPAVVALLLGAGAEVNARNHNEHWGTTPLHAAAHANHAPIVRLLLDHGADPGALDQNGRTPMDHTAFHKATAAAKVLASVSPAPAAAI